MENLTNHNISDQENTRGLVTGHSTNRRALLKAGWILPVIAVTPLMNTASAMSSVNCDELRLKLDMHRENKDREAFNDIRAKMEAAGCSR